jgi:hypothetical protein
MPPRRSARVAEAVELRTSALAPLPLPLVHRVFLLLPVDCRARAACVCRGWRAVLDEPALWTRLDLSGSSGVSAALERDALRGAAGRAQGRLCRLDLSGTQIMDVAEVLLPVLARNAGSLRELCVDMHYVNEEVAALDDEYPNLPAILAAAPQLRVLDAELYCHWPDAPRLLRAEAPLQLRTLEVRFGYEAGPQFLADAVGPLAAALADATLQPTLRDLEFSGLDARQPEVADALVDAALARRLRRLLLHDSTQLAAAPLARLLTGGALQHLTMKEMLGPLFDAAGAAVVADALRATTTLTTLGCILRR